MYFVQYRQDDTDTWQTDFAVPPDCPGGHFIAYRKLDEMAELIGSRLGWQFRFFTEESKEVQALDAESFYYVPGEFTRHQFKELRKT